MSKQCGKWLLKRTPLWSACRGLAGTCRAGETTTYTGSIVCAQLTVLRFLPADAVGDGSGAGNTAAGMCSAAGPGGAAKRNRHLIIFPKLVDKPQHAAAGRPHTRITWLFSKLQKPVARPADIERAWAQQAPHIVFSKAVDYQITHGGCTCD